MAKPHRINKNALQTPKKLGGLALPNLMYYYWHKKGRRESDEPGRHDVCMEMENNSSLFNLFCVIYASVPPLVNMFESNPTQ